MSEYVDKLIQIPKFLSDDAPISDGASLYATCPTLAQCGVCQSQCQNCLGTNCQSVCQTPAEGGCASSCDRTCQNCLGVSCQGACQTCQSTCQVSAQGSPPSGVPTINNVSTTANSISFSWSAVSGAIYYEIAYRLSTTSSATYETVYGTSTTISGLQPKTQYVINVRACNSYGKGSFGSGKTTTTASNRPSKWYWWSTIAAGEPINISASEWNSFCDNINEVREYMGYPSYGAFTTVRSGTTISAQIVNHAVWAIGAMKSTAMNYEVSSGDPVTASFFNGLKNILNSIT